MSRASFRLKAPNDHWNGGNDQKSQPKPTQGLVGKHKAVDIRTATSKAMSRDTEHSETQSLLHVVMISNLAAVH